MNESNSTAIIKDDDGFNNKGSPSWDKATMTIDRNFNQFTAGVPKVGDDNLAF